MFMVSLTDNSFGPGPVRATAAACRPCCRRRRGARWVLGLTSEEASQFGESKQITASPRALTWRSASFRRTPTPDPGVAVKIQKDLIGQARNLENAPAVALRANPNTNAPADLG